MMNKVFVGRIHATPCSEESVFGNSAGIVVNAAAYAESLEDFSSCVSNALKDYGLGVINIVDVKCISKSAIISYKKRSMRKTLTQAFKSHEVQFDTFFTYDKL